MYSLLFIIVVVGGVGAVSILFAWRRLLLFTFRVALINAMTIVYTLHTRLALDALDVTASKVVSAARYIIKRTNEIKDKRELLHSRRISDINHAFNNKLLYFAIEMYEHISQLSIISSRFRNTGSCQWNVPFFLLFRVHSSFERG